LQYGKLKLAGDWFPLIDVLYKQKGEHHYSPLPSFLDMAPRTARSRAQWVEPTK